jgi:hypothetical protein
MDKELPGKKYLIVLDDLSSNAEWDTIIPHLPATETSSRIIVTTRVKDIATHCSKKHENVYGLQSLEDNKALDLLIKKVRYCVFSYSICLNKELIFVVSNNIHI